MADPPVTQIHYTNWADELAPGHENYWWMVGTIADWIGYALEGSIHGCRQEPQFLSTIAVRQTKEKFGEVRCYCHLADTSSVQKKYDEKVKALLAKNEAYFKWKNGELDPDSRGYPQPWTIESYESRYPLEIPTREDFVQERVLEDAQWYRQVYLDAIKLWPPYEKAITGAADHWEYFFKTEEELEAHFDKRVEDVRECTAKYGWDNLSDRLDKLEQERQFSKKVCGFEGGEE